MAVEPILQIGVVGLGMAGASMVPAIASHPKFRLVGAADRNADLRARFAEDHKCEAHNDAVELFRREDIDAVYIATPHQFHCEHAVQAMSAGKHVVVEKPMALNIDDCSAMIDAERRNNRTLIIGHTHGFDPAVIAMRKMIARGEFGRLSMIAMWNYTDFLYRPRRPEELDTAKGGGVLFNQVPHQVDVARALAGGPLRAVRAMTGILDPQRPTEGSCMAFLDFADGIAASLIYSGYDYFDSDEMHAWIGEGGQEKKANHGSARRSLKAFSTQDAESQARAERYGYGSGIFAGAGGSRRHQPHFGVLIASCEKADLRPSTDGIAIYTESGMREIAIEPSLSRPGRSEVLDELYAAVVHGVRPVHDGAFGKGTVEACLAIKESARTRTEITFQRG
jgi:phthalate 4,5-cis-dihydrodiol dehydrogenase